MNFAPDLLLGILLISIGIILWVSIRTIAKDSPADKTGRAVPATPIAAESLNSNLEPIIVVSPGGKLKNINQKALDLFAVKENQATNLENLAKRSNSQEHFFRLCAEPGEYEFRINNQPVKAASYSLGQDALLIFRSINAELKENVHISQPSQFKTIADFTLFISETLDLSETIQRTLKKLQQMVPAEMIEINIWDDDSISLLPYRIQNTNHENKVINVPEKQKLGEGFTGLILQNNQQIWLENMENHPNYLTITDPDKHGYKSFMGFPLTAGHEVLGTLEFYSAEISGFQDEQRGIIEQVCPTISSAINNSILYKVENQRATELSSLAQLAQSLSYSREPEKIFEKMLVAITPMIPVEIMGFLLFNGATFMLEAQNPFVGLPGPFIEIFKTEIKKGSNAEKLMFSQDVLLTENAQIDLHWISLGLDHIARAASLRECVMVPLISGGATFGFLMAANHKNKSPIFSQVEMHLLMIVANQASPIIENMMLVQQSDQKAQSAETLRRIALFSSSNASQDAILEYSLAELVVLLQADIGAVFLLNQENAQLQMDWKSMYGESANDIAPDFLLTNDGQYPFTITGSQKPVVIGRFDAAEPIIPFYQKFYDEWKLQSLIIVPMLVRDEGIGEIWIGSGKPNFYDAGDIQTLIPAASQLAGVIEQQNLSMQTDDTLRKKVEQLTSLNRSNRDLNSTLDLEKLLAIMATDLKKISGTNAATVLLFDPNAEGTSPCTVLLSSDKTWQRTISEKEQCAFREGKNLFIDDAADIQLLGFSIETKGLMLFPIIKDQKALGALYLLQRKKSELKKEIAEHVQIYLNNTSVSLENALNYHQQSLQIAKLNQKIDLQQRIFSTTPFPLKGATFDSFVCREFDEINAFIPLNCLRIYEFDADSRIYKLACAQGECAHDLMDSSDDKVAWERVELLLNPEAYQNGFYQVPPNSLVKAEVSEDPFARTKSGSYLYPLMAASGIPSGLVCFETQSVSSLDKNSAEILELFMLRINSLLDSRPVLLDNEAQQRQKAPEPPELDEELPNTDWRSVEFINSLLNDELIRRMMELQDFHKALSVFSQALVESLHYPSAVIFKAGASGDIQVLETLNSEIDALRIAALLGQKNPIAEMFQADRIVQAEITNDSSAWFSTPLITELKARSLLAIPMRIMEGSFIEILASSVDIEPGFTEEQLDLLAKRINLVALLLQRQLIQKADSETLLSQRQRMTFISAINDLDPNLILETLLANAMELSAAAQAGWVGHWDETDQKLAPVFAKGYKNSNALLNINFSDADWSIPLVVLENQRPLCVNELNFASNYPLSAKDLVLYQQATGGVLPAGNLLLPMRMNGQNFGVLILENFNHAAGFTENDLAEISNLVDLAIPFLEKALIYQAVEENNTDLSWKQEQSNLLNQANSTLFNAHDLSTSIRSTLNHLMRGFNAEIGLLYLDGGELTVDMDEELRHSNHLDVSLLQGKIKEICAWLNLDPDIKIMNETYKNEDWINNFGQDFPFASILSTPLVSYGATLGTLLFAHSEPFSFQASHRNILDSLLPQINFVINSLDVSKKLADQSRQLVDLTIERESMESQSLAVLDALADVIIITDSNGKIEAANQAIEKVLGLSAQEIMHRQVDEFAASFNSDLDKWSNAIRVWVNNPLILNVDQSYTERISVSDQRILSLYAAPVIWQSKFLGAISVFRDITLEAQVDRMKSEFIANVSHELRTPLTSIKGYADLLLMGAAGSVPEQQTRFIDIINQNAARLTTLVDDLLDISKIESKHMDYYDQAVYIDRILLQLVKEFQLLSESERKPIDFDVRMPKNLKPVQGNEARLSQIIRNILENSYHYSLAPAKIIVRVSQTANETQVDIQDFGMGIKKEYQNHIFERFFRGEDELVLATSGTGLGLAVAKSLVELHSGQIWFYSSGIDGEGSVFSFTVPVYDEG
jgi:PAS domain S-box-containing protein